MAHIKKSTFYIKGMHCPSCDILVKDKFGECANIKKVVADYQTQKAEVYYTGNLDKKVLNDKIEPFGYRIGTQNEMNREPFGKRVFDASAIAVILFIIYFFAKELRLIPEGILQYTPTSYWAVFVLGLVASTSTCMATSGALFLATIGKLQSTSTTGEKPAPIRHIIPGLSFNLGRVLSYGFFGYIAGLFGRSLLQNVQFGSVFLIIIAVMMLLIGLDMAGVLPFSSLSVASFTKKLFEPLKKRFMVHPGKTSFFLGAITYFLPCGFTQTVQLFALSLADPVKSAAIMMIFALGTMPALLAIGFTSTLTKSQYYPLIAKTMGVIIIMIGFSYISNGLYLYNINLNVLSSHSSVSDQNVTMNDGYQVALMSVDGKGYSPSSFTVKKDTPVRWVIDGQNVFGCQGSLVAPKINVQKTLSKGKNVIEFTPHETGRIAFSCAMGMFQGEFNVVEG